MSEAKNYAVIRTSGQQLRVTPGQKITINRLTGDVGSEVLFNDVLAVSSGEGQLNIGTPLLSGASVKGKILAHTRGDKILIFKKRRRKGYQKTQGHRQELTSVQIDSIA